MVLFFMRMILKETIRQDFTKIYLRIMERAALKKLPKRKPLHFLNLILAEP